MTELTINISQPTSETRFILGTKEVLDISSFIWYGQIKLRFTFSHALSQKITLEPLTVFRDNNQSGAMS